MVLFVLCHYLDQFFHAKRFIDLYVAATEQIFNRRNAFSAATDRILQV